MLEAEASGSAVRRYRPELTRVLVMRQTGCHTLKIWVVADVCWPSAEGHVSLFHPHLCKRVGRILLSPGSVACKLELWDEVAVRVDRRDHLVDPHYQSPLCLIE